MVWGVNRLNLKEYQYMGCIYNIRKDNKCLRFYFQLADKESIIIRSFVYQIIQWVKSLWEHILIHSHFNRNSWYVYVCHHCAVFNLSVCGSKYKLPECVRFLVGKKVYIISHHDSIDNIVQFKISISKDLMWFGSFFIAK